MSANETPMVGGNHYRLGGFDHWDLVAKTGMGYFDGNATKYVARWRYKNSPVDDLKKALHYHNKLIDELVAGNLAYANANAFMRPGDAISRAEECARFCEANKLGDLERAYLVGMVNYRDVVDLEGTRELLLLIFDEAEAWLKIPEARPVPLTEENHYAERVTDQNSHAETQTGPAVGNEEPK